MSQGRSGRLPAAERPGDEGISELAGTGAKREVNEPTRGGRASLSADRWRMIRRTETITWMPHLSRRSRESTCAAPVKPYYVANLLQMAG